MIIPAALLTVVRRAALVAAIAALAVLAPADAGAQRADSTRAGAAPPRRALPARDSTRLRPPVSPRRAFLSSLLVPGLGQERLRRRRARTLFAAVEAGSIYMIAKSARDLREAKNAPDSIPYAYVLGTPLEQGTELPGGVLQPVLGPNLVADRVRARRVHLEDWAALLVFNHLLSGADAYVSANLWDLPAQVSPSLSPIGRGYSIGLRASLR